MNGWLQKIRMRRQCLLGANSVLHDTARVHNLAGCRSAIRIGQFSNIRGELLTFAHGGEIRIGEYCYIGEGTRIWSARNICLGDRVLIAHNVTLMDSLTHPISATARHNHFRQIITSGHPRKLDLGERSVEVGDDVWIGCQSVVLRGVTLGRGVIVGAGSVVTESVPAWTVVAGNPARVLRELDSDER